MPDVVFVFCFFYFLFLASCHLQLHARAPSLPRCTRAPVPGPSACSLLPGVTAAPASRLTSASESTQAVLKTTLNSIIATQSLHPYSWSTGRQIYLARDRVHLIDLALYPFILFKGTKRREQMQTVRSLCRVHFPSVSSIVHSFS